MSPMIQTDLFGICVTPEYSVNVIVVCNSYSITFARDKSSDKAPMYISHHHLTTIGKYHLWQSIWKTQTPDLKCHSFPKVMVILDCY